VERKNELLSHLGTAELERIDAAIHVLLDVLTDEHDRAT
jgi:hypothetical protein